MSEPTAVYRPHPEAPARTRLRSCAPPEAGSGIATRRFEFVSRGDFVPGLLFLPEDLPEANAASPGETSPAPLLLMQSTGLGTGSFTPPAQIVPWIRSGLAVATIDLPLHGERSSPKLSDRLLQGLDRLAPRDAETDFETRILVEEFSRQATSDLIRSLDALGALPQIDENRIGFLGIGIGGTVGCYLLAHDPRPRAAVFATVAPLRGAPDLDPTIHLARASGPSILVLETEAPETNHASDALFEAAPEPKERLMLSRACDPACGLDEETAGKVEPFLRRELKF